MTYDDFNLIANPSGQGYVQSGSTQYYYEEALTNTVVQGELSYNVNGKSQWYTLDGQASSEFIGKLKNDIGQCDSDGTLNSDGLYIKQMYHTLELLTADALIGDIFYDQTDPQDPVHNIVAISDLDNVYTEYDPRLFINTSDWQTIWYNRQITNTADTSTLTELDKVGLKSDLYEKVVDSEGVIVIDSNGKIVIAPKLTTTFG